MKYIVGNNINSVDIITIINRMKFESKEVVIIVGAMIAKIVTATQGI